jgi:hypothetical protein
VYDLTGLDSADWLLVVLMAVGVSLVVLAFIKGSGRSIAIRIVPLVSGAAVLGTLAITQTGRLVDTVRARNTSLAGVVIILLVTAGSLALVWTINRRYWSTAVGAGDTRDEPDAVRADRSVGVVGALAVMVAVLVAVGGGWLTERRIESAIESTSTTTSTSTSTTAASLPPPIVASASEPFSFGWSLQAPGFPLGMTHDEARNALWVTLGEGQIVRYDLDADPSVAPQDPPTVVADGLLFPRGIAVVADLLLVSETGEVPCPTPFPSCRGEDVPGAADGYVGETQLLQESAGRVSVFQILADGSLGSRETLIDDLPVANTDHAPNGMAEGVDGSVYLSIGHIDRLFFDLAAYEAIDHPNKNLLGTVIRIDTTTGSFEVVAEGMRNVFAITQDPLGDLWGADNDGQATTSFRREEVLRIRQGAHFGYPVDGTAPPFTIRTDPATYVLDSAVGGSSGIAWVENVEGQQGLLLGAGATVSFLKLEIVDGVYQVFNDLAYRRATTAEGWVVAIEPMLEQAVVFAEYGSNVIRYLTWTG